MVQEEKSGCQTKLQFLTNALVAMSAKPSDSALRCAVQRLDEDEVFVTKSAFTKNGHNAGQDKLRGRLEMQIFHCFLLTACKHHFGDKTDPFLKLF